jgi:hypothetical protein
VSRKPPTRPQETLIISEESDCDVIVEAGRHASKSPISTDRKITYGAERSGIVSMTNYAE